MRVYIAGKITGLPHCFAEGNFRRLEDKLTKLGFEVVNPYKEGQKLKDPSYEDYIIHGLKLLSTCQAICFLPDWSTSKGALLEEHYAKLCGKHIMFADYLDTLFPDKEKESGN